MRYPASAKLEIIRLVEQSHLSARRTLQKLGIPRSTFNRWYDRFLAGGVDALEDRRPRPNRVWNRIPEAVRDQIVTLALEEPERSVTIRRAKGGLTVSDGPFAESREHIGGFYLLEAGSGDLLVGPFQGKPACVRIPLDKGVCGAAASQRTTIVVPVL